MPFSMLYFSNGWSIGTNISASEAIRSEVEEKQS